MFEWTWCPLFPKPHPLYYQSLGAAISYYRGKNLSYLRGVANYLFDEDLKIVTASCVLPPRTMDDATEVRNTIYAMLSRKKYYEICHDLAITFAISSSGEIIFDDLAKRTIVERYAKFLLEITPDREYLIRRISEPINVKFEPSNFKY